MPMNAVYKEIAENLLDSIKKYMNGEITIEELRMADRMEGLMHEKDLRGRVFERVKKLHDELIETDSKIRRLEGMIEGEELEIDLEGILSHSEMLGRNRAPPAGFEHSNWYVPPFPTLQMLDNRDQ